MGLRKYNLKYLPWVYNYLVKGIVALSMTLVTKTTPHEPLSKGLEFGGARARSLVFERVGLRGFIVFGLWFVCFCTVGVLGFLFSETLPHLLIKSLAQAVSRGQ